MIKIMPRIILVFICPLPFGETRNFTLSGALANWNILLVFSNVAGMDASVKERKSLRLRPLESFDRGLFLLHKKKTILKVINVVCLLSTMLSTCTNLKIKY